MPISSITLPFSIFSPNLINSRPRNTDTSTIPFDYPDDVWSRLSADTQAKIKTLDKRFDSCTQLAGTVRLGAIVYPCMKYTIGFPYLGLEIACSLITIGSVGILLGLALYCVYLLHQKMGIDSQIDLENVIEVAPREEARLPGAPPCYMERELDPLYDFPESDSSESGEGLISHEIAPSEDFAHNILAIYGIPTPEKLPEYWDLFKTESSLQKVFQKAAIDRWLARIGYESEPNNNQAPS